MQPQAQQAPVAALAVDDVTARVYTLRTNGHEVLVDAGNKGKPGDTVVLWPKKKAPVVCRKLARVAPYSFAVVARKLPFKCVTAFLGRLNQRRRCFKRRVFG